jgi:hypothetical protein
MAYAVTGILQLGFQGTGAIARSRFVTLDGDPQKVKQADAAGQRAVGVANEPLSTADQAAGKSGGRAIQVVMLGIVFVEASAAIALGALVATTSTGKAATAATTNVPLGIALTAAAADKDLMAVLLTPGLPALP